MGFYQTPPMLFPFWIVTAFHNNIHITFFIMIECIFLLFARYLFAFELVFIFHIFARRFLCIGQICIETTIKIRFFLSCNLFNFNWERLTIMPILAAIFA